MLSSALLDQAHDYRIPDPVHLPQAGRRGREHTVKIPELVQQTPREEAVAGECAITGTLDTVTLKSFRAFILHVGQLWDRELHPKGHFVLRDACRGFGIQRLYGTLAVYRIDGLNQLFLEVTRIATGTCNVVNGISLRLKRNTLVAGWEKAC